MHSLTSGDLIAALRTHQLLQPGQITALGEVLAAEPADFLNDLVARGWLTPYQAEQLLHGGAPGLQLGQYVVLDLLGEGGMGRVLKARHRRLDRIDAVKVVRPDLLASPDLVHRFHREARAAARLRHPNLVTVYNADEWNGTHYIAMEFLAGLSLSRLVRQEGPLPAPTACEYARQAALGLSHAHEQGLVHRDVKPQNLLVVPDEGRVVVLDLGLARLLPAPESPTTLVLTGADVLMGTADFIAPEQARDAAGADHRADLYALGCTLYFLLSGQVPFPGGGALAKALRHQNEETLPLERLCPGLPRGLGALVRGLMAKSPADRPRTAELIAELTLFAAPLSAAPSPSVPPVLSSSGGAPPYRTKVPPPLSPLPTPASPGAPLGGTHARPVRPSRRLWPWAAGASGVLALAVAGAFWFPRTMQHGPAGPDAGRPEPPAGAEGPRPGRAGLPLFGRQPLARLTMNYKEQEVFGLAFSPDSKYLAAAGGYWPEKENEKAKPPKRCSVPVWTVADRRSHKEFDVWSAFPVEFSPDGKCLAVACGDYDRDVPGWVYLLDPEARKERFPPLKLNNSGVFALSFHPEGRVLAAGGKYDAIYRVDPSTGTGREWFQGHKGAVNTVPFAPGGKLLASAGQDGKIRLWDVTDLEHPALLVDLPETPGAPVYQVAFSPDGQRLAAVSGPPPKLGFWDVAGWRCERLVELPDASHNVVFSWDGKHVVTGGQDKVHVWDAQTGDLTQEVAYGGTSMFGLAVSPRDGYLAVGSGWGEPVLLYGPAP